MKYSLIISDNVIISDSWTIHLDLSSKLGEVHALHWYGDKGSIEWANGEGVAINELPVWAQEYIDQALEAYEASLQPSTVVKTLALARAEGEAYVSQYFTLMQLQRLQLMLVSSTTASGKLVKIQAILGWLDYIEQAWITNPSTFDASSFGEPPYTYESIYGS